VKSYCDIAAEDEVTALERKEVEADSKGVGNELQRSLFDSMVKESAELDTPHQNNALLLPCSPELPKLQETVTFVLVNRTSGTMYCDQ
jgi:hypothetical protein